MKSSRTSMGFKINKCPKSLLLSEKIRSPKR